MSAGTRSKAMTAQAPASSARRAYIDQSDQSRREMSKKTGLFCVNDVHNYTALGMETLSPTVLQGEVQLTLSI